jgi:hypothetical protein
MHLHVLFDTSGNIIALGEISPRQGGFVNRLTDAPAARPRPMKDQLAAELEVPEEHAHKTLLELHEQLKVDVTAATPRLVPKRSTASQAELPRQPARPPTSRRGR